MDFFFLLIRRAHKKFRVPSLCRRIVIHIYIFLFWKLKKIWLQEHNILKLCPFKRCCFLFFSFNLQRNKGFLNFIQVRKGQRHISLSFSLSFPGSLNSLIASLVMNFVPFLSLLALSCSLFVFAPTDCAEWPTERAMGERDWSKLFLFREWFPLHFDSSSTAAANHSVSKPNLKATPRLKHRLTALALFFLGLNFGMLHQFASTDKSIKVITAFVSLFDALLIPHSRNPKGKWVNEFWDRLGGQALVLIGR